MLLKILYYFGYFFFQKKGIIVRIFFFKNSFCKIAKFCHQKKIPEMRTKKKQPKNSSKPAEIPIRYYLFRDEGERGIIHLALSSEGKTTILCNLNYALRLCGKCKPPSWCYRKLWATVVVQGDGLLVHHHNMHLNSGSHP